MVDVTTESASTTLLRRADQIQVNAMGGVLQAIKPVVGGQSADGAHSAGLYYWSHSHFTDNFEFGLHRHEGFEIVTFVLDGENSHFDSEGKTWVPLHKGDVQIIRSGSGISHNERVAKGTRAFQIWFDPGYDDALQRTPDYSDHPASTFTTEREGVFGVTDYIGGRGPVRTLVEGLAVRRLTSEIQAAETVSLGDDRYSILYVIDGQATIEGNQMETDDALVLRGNDETEVVLSAGADLFQVSLALHPSYKPVRGR
jgi:redox-sensitive bicupin YhaK (pirin superfamily)